MALIPYPKVDGQHLVLTGFSLAAEHFNDFSENPVGVLKVKAFSFNPAGRMRGLLQWFGYGIDPVSQKHLIALQQFFDGVYDTDQVNHTVIPINEMTYQNESMGRSLFLPTPTATEFADVTTNQQTRNSTTGKLETTIGANRTFAVGQFLNMTVGGIERTVQITDRLSARRLVLRPAHRVPAQTPLKRATALTIRPDLAVQRPNVIFSNENNNAPLTMQWLEYVPE